MPFSAELRLVQPVEETSNVSRPRPAARPRRPGLRAIRAQTTARHDQRGALGVAEGCSTASMPASGGILSEGFHEAGVGDGPPVHDRHRGAGDLAVGLALGLALHQGRHPCTGTPSRLCTPCTTESEDSARAHPVNITSFLVLDAEFWTTTVGGTVFATVWAVLMYLLTRHTGRELAPPAALPDNPAHWRPQLKRWGVPSGE